VGEPLQDRIDIARIEDRSLDLPSEASAPFDIGDAENRFVLNIHVTYGEGDGYGIRVRALN
jgi:hypothetical protein